MQAAFSLRILLMLLSGLLISGQAFADESAHEQAKQWLKRMMHASQTVSYQGTFAYIKGQEVDVMRIVNSNDARSKGQRMYSLTGPTREIVVADDNVMCLLPKQQVALNKTDRKRSPFPISLPHDLAQLENSYRFSMLGDDRVAGMKTRIIAINPKDNLRFGYRLWLEHDSGIVLRSALIGLDGEILEQLIFTDITISQEIDISLLTPQYLSVASATRLQQPSGKAVRQSIWKVTDLPHGFFKLSHNRFPETSTAYPTEHIVFSDGLATVSVFLEHLSGQTALFEGAAQMGLVNAYGVVRDGYQIVSVGEVPVETVERIATTINSEPAKQ